MRTVPALFRRLRSRLLAHKAERFQREWDEMFSSPSYRDQAVLDDFLDQVESEIFTVVRCGHCNSVHSGPVDDLCRYYLQNLTKSDLEEIASELEPGSEEHEHVLSIHPIDG